MQLAQDNEFKNMMSGINNPDPDNMDNFVTLLQKMSDGVEKERMFFDEQVAVIEKISPLMSEYLRYLLSEFEDIQSQITDELRDMKFPNMENNSEFLNQIQYIDGLVAALSKCYDELYNTISTSYNCFGGVLNFMEDVDADQQMTKRKPTKRKKKNVK